MTPRRLSIVLKTEVSITSTVILTPLSAEEVFRRGLCTIRKQLGVPMEHESTPDHDPSSVEFVLFDLNIREISSRRGLYLWAQILNALERA